MTLLDDTTRLRHLLEHAMEAINLAQGHCRADLDTDRKLELALTRLVEIAGEAGSRVSRPCQENHPDIPWREITGLRNRLAHGYDAVDLDILWDIIQMDFPPLVAVLKKLVESENPSI
jgi:uncharacterized protein with HEPN domain